jgi:hypothetical protein
MAAGTEVWSDVVTAVITGVATLTGVGIAQRHATTLRRLDRHDARRNEEVAAVVEALATGQEWATSLFNLLLAAAQLRPGEDVRGSAAFKTYLPTPERHWRALLRARLLVRDEEVRAHMMHMFLQALWLPLLAIDGRIHHEKDALKDALEEPGSYQVALIGLESLIHRRLIRD